jgi:uncharacterized repeat protein (TIGR03803 family)
MRLLRFQCPFLVALLAGCGGTQPFSASSAITQASAMTSPPYGGLYFFGGPGASDGAFAEAPLVDVNGTLYGTTGNGGTSGFGTVYSISPSGTEQVLYSFMGGSDGENPVAGLTNVSGTLYGTTSRGGLSDQGTVFSISASGSETELHSFSGNPDG